MHVKFSFWKALSVASYTLSFLAKASEDGKITLDELLEYLQGLANQLGVNVEIKLPEQQGGQA